VTFAAPAAVHSSATTILEKFWTTANPRSTLAAAGDGGCGPPAVAYTGDKSTIACGARGSEQFMTEISLTAVAS
jgi:hypothetical protein